MTIKDLKALVLWLRSEQIAYSTLTAGDVTIDGVIDLKQDPGKPAAIEAKPTMYQKFGGELLRQPTAKRSEVVPDEAMIDD
jgi:hypothetical protein